MDKSLEGLSERASLPESMNLGDLKKDNKFGGVLEFPLNSSGGSRRAESFEFHRKPLLLNESGIDDRSYRSCPRTQKFHLRRDFKRFLGDSAKKRTSFCVFRNSGKRVGDWTPTQAPFSDSGRRGVADCLVIAKVLKQIFKQIMDSEFKFTFKSKSQSNEHSVEVETSSFAN